MDNNILNFITNTESIYGVLDIFKEDFLDSFNEFTVKDRLSIIKAMPYLYRMWYYSALIDDSTLSPANFINHQINEKFGEETLIVPIPSPVYKRKVLKDFEYQYILFTVDDHPVLKDLKLFLDYCTPDVGVGENGLLLDSERDNIINQLTFKEIFYITFLTNTCYSLNLLKKMRGINTYRAMPIHKNIDEFLNYSNLIKLQKIIDSTINYASKSLTSLLPYDKKSFSKEAIREIFSNSLNLDDFMENIYKKHNINIDDLTDLDFSNISEIKSAEDVQKLNISKNTLDAIFLKLEFSFIFDTHLLTPLGYYLQLIKPLYLESIDFDIKFSELIEAVNIPNFPLIKLYFNICSEYDLTYIGRKVLLENADSVAENQSLKDLPDFNTIYNDIKGYRNPFSETPFDLDEDFFNSLINENSIFSSQKKSSKKSASVNSDEKNNKVIKASESKDALISDKNKIYSFKVKHFHNKRSYKVIEIKSTQSLEDLAQSIISNFGLDFGHLYSFFMNNKAYDADYEITCPFNNTTKNITPRFKINKLSLEPKQKFMFLYDFGDDITFEVEFLNTTDIEKGVKYPRVTKESKTK